MYIFNCFSNWRTWSYLVPLNWFQSFHVGFRNQQFFRDGGIFCSAPNAEVIFRFVQQQTKDKRASAERGETGERKVPPLAIAIIVSVLNRCGCKRCSDGRLAALLEEKPGIWLDARTKPMLGFQLFFPSPMQKEICSEASPSSIPVYWGCAWVRAQVFQVTSI